jgi:hypothetical protein
LLKYCTAYCKNNMLGWDVDDKYYLMIAQFAVVEPFCVRILLKGLILELTYTFQCLYGLVIH